MITAVAAGVVATCAIAGLVALLVAGQSSRCRANVHEIGSRLFRLEAHVGISSTCSNSTDCHITGQQKGILD